MPTNTEEPIGWGVEQVNELYQATTLPELENRSFRDLFPKTCTPHQETAALKIAQNYNKLVKSAIIDRERSQQKRPEDEQPTLTLTTSTDRQLTIQKLCDADPQGRSPIWRAEGTHPDWKIKLQRNANFSDRSPERFSAQLTYIDDTGVPQQQLLGYISPESADQHKLAERLQGKDALTLKHPHLQLKPPYLLQNDVEEKLSQASEYLKEAIAQIPPDERMAYASALWHHSEGMGVVLRGFTAELCQQLQQNPAIALRGIQRPTNEAGQIPDGEYQVRFSEYSYTSDFSGKANTSPSIAIVQPDGSEQQFGAISNESLRLPKGSLARAEIHTTKSGKVATMQILERLDKDGPPAERDRHPLSSDEARSWYMATSLQDNPNKLEQILQLGKTLQQHYNQEHNGDGTLKPPGDYTHTAVTISAAEQQRMGQDVTELRAILQQTQRAERRSEMAL
jgi:hypothetical protein